MRHGQDIATEFPGLYLVHHNLPGAAEALHRHAEHQLLIPLAGEIRVETAAAALILGPGRMVYLPPGEDHAFHSAPRQGERLIALIKPSAWDGADGPQAPASIVPAHQLVKELLFYLLLTPGTRHASALLKTLVHTVAETLEASPPAAAAPWHQEGRARDPRLKKALAILAAEVAEPPTTQDLARRSGLSVRSLNRLFLSELGLTPKQAQAQARIATARDLLATSALSVTEVALAVGYQSLSQFIATFRQITGQLPSEVRRHA